MKPKELRELTDDEVGRHVRELKREGFNLRMQQVTGQLTDSAQIRKVRRDVARLLTEQTARQKKTAAAATTDGK